MDISFVILNYNRKNELLDTIARTKSLIQNIELSCEIIVVDNASADGSTAAVATQHPGVILISRQKNIGIAGWNDGFERAQGKYMLVLDDDSHVENGITGAIDYLNQHAGVGILALNVVGGAFQTKDDDEWKDKQPCNHFIGCGAIIRKEVYNMIGGFAEWLFIYTHEMEYAIRCLQAGYNIHYFADCHVMHRTSVVNRTSKRLKIFSTRNEMAICYKYFGANRNKYIWRIFINRLKFIKTEGLSTGYYILLAGLEFLKMKKHILHTPVSKNIQAYYVETFSNLEPVFKKMQKRLSVAGGK